jgi:hypothetical protein
MKYRLWIGAGVVLLIVVAIQQSVGVKLVKSLSERKPQITTSSCGDPFASVSTLRFNPELWTTKELAGYINVVRFDPSHELQTNFCKHSVDYNEIISGGPPPDGIPPIDNPTFESIAKGERWLVDGQPVIALAMGKVAKAYPLAILTRHEIANDEIDGVPVVVTFCPLCNAAIVFKRTVNDEVLRFGVSGYLRNSDLIMWDNKTLSWWQQFTGEAIVGDLTGTQLEVVPSQLVSWKDFKTAYPKGVVLSRNTRDYGTNPYTEYDSSEKPFLYFDTPDPRLPAMTRVLGYFSNQIALAYPLTAIAKAGVIEDSLDGQSVVVFYAPGQLSALDKPVIADSKAVGSATLFNTVIDGRKLTFSYHNGIISDNETRSQWDVFGRAINGELMGTQLNPVLPSNVHFWFAWAAFKPETKIFSHP